MNSSDRNISIVAITGGGRMFIGDCLIIARKLLEDLGNKDMPWSYFLPKTISFGGWEPNYDLEAWHNKQRLIIYVQGARQGRCDYGIEGHSSPCWLYEFMENEH